MATYRLTLEYDGGAYHGWQQQPDQVTVEGVLRQALSSLRTPASRLTAASRTDAGAHSHGQVVGIELERDWVPGRLAEALNANLPDDVLVTGVEPVGSGFHARHDARSRTYRYLVVPHRRRSPHSRRLAWSVAGELNIEAMREAGRALVGRHDFAAFGRSPRAGGATVRTVERATVRRIGLHDGAAQSPMDTVIIEVTANAFLYGMMRSIAGVLVEVGLGRIGADAVTDMLANPRVVRSRPVVAPAHGLHQWTVTYA